MHHFLLSGTLVDAEKIEKNAAVLLHSKSQSKMNQRKYAHSDMYLGVYKILGLQNDAKKKTFKFGLVCWSAIGCKFWETVKNEEPLIT